MCKHTVIEEIHVSTAVCAVIFKFLLFCSYFLWLTVLYFLLVISEGNDQMLFYG